MKNTIISCKPVDMYELTARVKSLLRVKQYYDALIEEQDKLLIYKSALNSMDDCVIITTTSGDIKFVNPAFEKKFGYSQTEISGMRLKSVAPSPTKCSDRDLSVNLLV